LWYAEPNAVSNAIGYAKFFSRTHDAVIRVYDEAGNVIETRNGAPSFSGKSVDWRTGIQYCRKRLPIGVLGPTRMRS
jgi:hypothetical protein